MNDKKIRKQKSLKVIKCVSVLVLGLGTLTGCKARLYFRKAFDGSAGSNKGSWILSETDPAHAIGTNIKIKSNNSDKKFDDLFESNVKTMEAHTYIDDYYEFVYINGNNYEDYGLTLDDFLVVNDQRSSNLTLEAGEKLKALDNVIRVYFYNSKDEYAPSYYLPKIMIVKDTWKEYLKPSEYDWFIQKMKQEQENIVKSNNTNWALKNYFSDDIETIDLAQEKGHIPYKIGEEYLTYKDRHENELSIFAKNGKGALDYITKGKKNTWNNSSLAYNNDYLQSKYKEFSIDNVLNDGMEFDDYNDLLFTAKENVAINNVSFDLEVYNPFNEEITFENDYQSSIYVGFGNFRAEQVETYKNYVKRISGLSIAKWLAPQNMYDLSGGYNSTYIFKEYGQTKYWEYHPKEERDNFYFRDGETYHVSLDYKTLSNMVGSGNDWSKEKVDTFRLIIPKSCNLSISLNGKGKNTNSFWRIKNLKVDCDEIKSWDYVAWYKFRAISHKIGYVK